MIVQTRKLLFTLVCSVFPRSNAFTIFLSRGTGSKSTKFFSKSSFHLPRSCLGSFHNVSIVVFFCIPGAKKEKRKVKLGPCANFIPLLLALLQAEITDLPTLSYTSTSEIPTLSYDLKPAKLYPFRAKAPHIGH